MGTELCLEIKINLEATRCNTCHRWWAQERYMGDAACPFCKSDYYTHISDTNAVLKSRVASLKGQLTRLRRKHEDKSSPRK